MRKQWTAAAWLCCGLLSTNVWATDLKEEVPASAGIMTLPDEVVSIIYSYVHSPLSLSSANCRLREIFKNNVSVNLLVDTPEKIAALGNFLAQMEQSGGSSSSTTFPATLSMLISPQANFKISGVVFGRKDTPFAENDEQLEFSETISDVTQHSRARVRKSAISGRGPSKREMRSQEDPVRQRFFQTMSGPFDKIRSDAEASTISGLTSSDRAIQSWQEQYHMKIAKKIQQYFPGIEASLIAGAASRRRAAPSNQLKVSRVLLEQLHDLCPEIKKLILRGAVIEGKNVSSAFAQRRQEHPHHSHHTFPDQQAHEDKKLPHFEEISIEEGAIDPRHFLLFSGVKNVYLNVPALDDDLIRLISDLSTLKSLCIVANSFASSLLDGDKLSMLSKLRDLEFFSLQIREFNNRVILPFTLFPKLKYWEYVDPLSRFCLKLSNPKPFSPENPAIDGAENASFVESSAEDFTEFLRNREVCELSYRSDRSREEIAHILTDQTKLGSLKSLEIWGKLKGVQPLELLPQLQNLQVLSLIDLHEISSEKFVDIAQYVSGLKHLRALNLDAPQNVYRLKNELDVITNFFGALNTLSTLEVLKVEKYYLLGWMGTPDNPQVTSLTLPNLRYVCISWPNLAQYSSVFLPFSKVPQLTKLTVYHQPERARKTLSAHQFPLHPSLDLRLYNKDTHDTDPGSWWRENTRYLH